MIITDIRIEVLLFHHELITFLDNARLWITSKYDIN